MLNYFFTILLFIKECIIIYKKIYYQLLKNILIIKKIISIKKFKQINKNIYIKYVQFIFNL